MFIQHRIRKFSSILFRILLVMILGGLVINATPLPVARANASTANSLSVGVVLPSQSVARWEQDGIWFNLAFADAGYTSTVLFSQNSSAIEKANVETLIAQGISVLIICPVNGDAAAAAVEVARAAGVKVIAYDRMIRNTAAVDYYITFDTLAVGSAQGQYLVSKATDQGNPLYLYAGHAFDNNAFLFFEGSWQVLQPKIADGTFVIKNSSAAVALQSHATLTHDEQAAIIAQITTEWNPGTASTLAQANLAGGTAADKGDVFILAPADFIARAISDVFAADADVSSYVITGQDAEWDSVQYIINGKQAMTIFKDVRTLAKDAAAAAVTYLEGRTPVATKTYDNGTINVPSKPSALVTVDKNNLKAALIDTDYYHLTDFNWSNRLLLEPAVNGVLTSPFDSTIYSFSSGTFTDTVVITHTATFSATSSGRLEGIGHSFDITAIYSDTQQAAQPTTPYTITIQYTDEQKGALNESTLALYYWDGGQWIRETTSTVDIESNQIAAAPDHFSTWAVMGEIRRVYYLPLMRR